jgi:hypothetical protein
MVNYHTSAIAVDDDIKLKENPSDLLSLRTAVKRIEEKIDLT